MTNIAAAFRDEITRLARKEVRAEIASLKKASTAYRVDIATLKRQLKEMQRALRQATKANASAQALPSKRDGAAEQKVKFSAKGLKSHRKTLGLSAKDYGLLVGASGLSIYKWEDGKAVPREKFLPNLAAMRRIGKREAVKRLAELSGTSAS